MECPLLALSRHAVATNECPLSGVKRTCVVATLHNHEILTDNDLAFEIFCDWLPPGVVTDTINRRRQMRQHERLYSRFLGNPADVFRRCVIGLHMRHKGLELDGSASGDLILDVFFDRGNVHRLVHQHVGAFGHVRDRFERRGVAGKCD